MQVTVSPPPTAPITLTYTAGGSASAGTDYTALSGTVTVPAGAAGATIPVAIMDDNAVEGSETLILVILSLSAGEGYSLGTSVHTVTIADNDDDDVVVSISGGEDRVTEEGSFLSSDQLASRSIQMDATGTATFRVSTEDDSVYERSGAVTAVVEQGSGYQTHPAQGEATVRVEDNDRPPLVVDELRRLLRLALSHLVVSPGGSAA